MKSPSTRTYPDISDILARKAEGRRELASRSFGEKIETLEAMRERAELIRKARKARKSDQASTLIVENRDDLTRAFQALGVTVGSRRGPNRRTKDEREWYCLRRYLLTLAEHELLNYPLQINKSETPDFIISDSSRGVFGIEITEATEESWQRELTETEAVEGEDPATAILIGEDGFAGDNPEIDWCAAVTSAVEKKLSSLAGSNCQIGTCDLLVYVNSRMSSVVDANKAIIRLLAAVTAKKSDWQAHSRLGRVTVLTDNRMIYDLVGVPRIFETSAAQAHVG